MLIDQFRKWVSATIAVLLVVHSLQAQEKGDWTQFRGPAGIGASQEKGLPTKWSPEENIAWKVPLPGAGASSPVLIGQKIFLSCYSGYGVPGEEGDPMKLERKVVCLDRKDGKTIWTKSVPGKLPEQPPGRNPGYAASTLAVDAERVYAFFGKSGVHAFDHQGKPLWAAAVGDEIHGFGSGASPVIYKDVVIVNACVESGSLIGFNKKTGKEVWRAKGIVESWCTPVLVEAAKGKFELVLPMAGKIVAYDPQSGKELWTCATGIDSYVVPSVVAAEGVVYMIGGRPSASLAVRAGGKGDVTDSHRIWTARHGAIVTSPVYHEGHLYWINDQGIAYVVEGKTGKVVVEKRLSEGGGELWGSPLLADGKVYFFFRGGGSSLVLAAKPKFETVAVNDSLDHWSVNFEGSPIPSAGQLLVRSNRDLYCLGKK